MISFSFSHSLTSLFCTPPLRNLRASHFATLARLRSPCTCNLSRFISSLSSTPSNPFSLKSPNALLLFFHQTSHTPYTPPLSPHTSLPIHHYPLLPLALLPLSLPEVAQSADVVFARRRPQDVLLPDGRGQPAPTSGPQAPPPTYPQSVSPPKSRAGVTRCNFDFMKVSMTELHIRGNKLLDTSQTHTKIEI